MSSVSEFVAAAVKADPTLAGSSDKDKAAISKLEGETEGYAKDLAALNTKLTPLTYLHSNAPSSADVSLYCHLHPSIASAPASQHPSQPSVLRYFLHVQSFDGVHAAQSALPNSFPPLDIDISSLPTPPRQVIAPVKKEKKPKAAAAAATATGEQQGEGLVAAVSAGAASAAAAVGGAVAAAKDAVLGAGPEKDAKEGKKKEKKEKPAKAAPAKVEAAKPTPGAIQLIVGKIVDVKAHPDADSLYVEQIDCGEAEPRTICSGLRAYLQLEDLQDKLVVVVANLKPVKMRGVTSAGMLLCSSGKEKSDGVDTVVPPEGSQPGDRIYFEGFQDVTPEAQLNPKKKVFETFQPDFTSLDDRTCAWVDPETKKAHLMVIDGKGPLKTKTMIGANLS